MNNIEFTKKLKDIAENYKTLYVMGCFGSPLTPQNKLRYTVNHPYNTTQQRKSMINGADSDTFGFDCVCLIKGVLWGWDGNKNKTYGGAVYGSSGVPDLNADGMFAKCKKTSSVFSNLTVGEAVWTNGHIGVYIGDGLAVECTPSWKNCVQITSCNCDKKGYNRRNWKKHGFLPYITYEKESEKKKMLESGNDIIWELMNGKHKIKIDEVSKAVKALDNAKKDKNYSSLYWILYKVVNGNG